MWIFIEESEVEKRGLEYVRERITSRNELNHPGGEEYLKAAKEHHYREGELEFDDNAVVSISEDGGAYVMGWKWITDEEIGLKECDDCEGSGCAPRVESGPVLCITCEGSGKVKVKVDKETA